MMRVAWMTALIALSGCDPRAAGVTGLGFAGSLGEGDSGECVPPSRVMAFGDSITAGCHGDDRATGAWRMMLQQRLDEHGVEYDMVGGLRANCPDAELDRDHEGHSGMRIEEGTAIAADLVAEHDPDIVVVGFGTNNYRSDPGTDFTQPYAELFAALDGPTVYAFTPPPIGYGRHGKSYWTDDWVDDRNETLRAMGDAVRASGVNVVESGLDPAAHLTGDRVHPNAAGQRVMADALWAEISREFCM